MTAILRFDWAATIVAASTNDGIRMSPDPPIFPRRYGYTRLKGLFVHVHVLYQIHKTRQTRYMGNNIQQTIDLLDYCYHNYPPSETLYM